MSPFRPLDLAGLGMICFHVPLNKETPCLNVRREQEEYSLVAESFEASGNANRPDQARLFDTLKVFLKKPLPTEVKRRNEECNGVLKLDTRARVILSVYKKTIQPCSKPYEIYFKELLGLFLTWHKRTYFDFNDEGEKKNTADKGKQEIPVHIFRIEQQLPPFLEYKTPRLGRLAEYCLNIHLDEKSPYLNVRINQDRYFLVAESSLESKQAKQAYQARLLTNLNNFLKSDKKLPSLRAIKIKETLMLNERAKIILAIFNQTIRPCSEDEESYFRELLAFCLEQHLQTYFQNCTKEQSKQKRASHPTPSRVESNSRILKKELVSSSFRGESVSKLDHPRLSPAKGRLPRHKITRREVLKLLSNEALQSCVKHWIHVVHRTMPVDPFWEKKLTVEELRLIKKVNLFRPCFQLLLAEQVERSLTAAAFQEYFLSQDIHRHLHRVRISEDTLRGRVKPNPEEVGLLLKPKSTDLDLQKARFTFLLENLCGHDEELHPWLMVWNKFRASKDKDFASLCQRFLLSLKGDKLRTLLSALSQCTYVPTLLILRKLLSEFHLVKHDSLQLRYYLLPGKEVKFHSSIMDASLKDRYKFPFAFPPFKLEVLNKLSFKDTGWFAELEFFIHLEKTTKKIYNYQKKVINDKVISPLRRAGIEAKIIPPVIAPTIQAPISIGCFGAYD